MVLFASLRLCTIAADNRTPALNIFPTLNQYGLFLQQYFGATTEARPRMSNTMVNTILNKTKSAITIVKQSINAAVGTVNILEWHGTFQKVDGRHPTTIFFLIIILIFLKSYYLHRHHHQSTKCCCSLTATTSYTTSIYLVIM